MTKHFSVRTNAHDEGRTINTHATLMITVTMLAITDLGWRLSEYHTRLVTPAGITLLSVVVALLVMVGATFGGGLVFVYGFNVESAADPLRCTTRPIQMCCPVSTTERSVWAYSRSGT